MGQTVVKQFIIHICTLENIEPGEGGKMIVYPELFARHFMCLLALPHLLANLPYDRYGIQQQKTFVINQRYRARFMRMRMSQLFILISLLLEILTYYGPLLFRSERIMNKESDVHVFALTSSLLVLVLTKAKAWFDPQTILYNTRSIIKMIEALRLYKHHSSSCCLLYLPFNIEGDLV
jgi:hypothetical protein